MCLRGLRTRAQEQFEAAKGASAAANRRPIGRSRLFVSVGYNPRMSRSILRRSLPRFPDLQNLCHFFFFGKEKGGRLFACLQPAKNLLLCWGAAEKLVFFY